MKQLLLSALLTAALVSPAYATDVTITLSDEDQQKLVALLDLAVKQGGIKAVTAASDLLKKIDDAKKEEPKP